MLDCHGEETEVFQKYIPDIPLLAHLHTGTVAYPVGFDPYSPYFMDANEYNLRLQAGNFYKFIYPFSCESLTDLAHYFTGQNMAAD